MIHCTLCFVFNVLIQDVSFILFLNMASLVHRKLGMFLETYIVQRHNKEYISVL